MHAILHDAAGFVREVYNTGPTYCYVLPWKCNSSLIGHLSGITYYVLFVYQTEKTETLPFIRMLKEKSVVVDFEGFRHQKNTFIVKELAITTSDYSDSLVFFSTSS